MLMSYFSVKLWTGKKQGKKTPESLLRFPAMAALDLSGNCPTVLYQCQKFRRDNTDSKWYQVMRSLSHKVPSITIKIVIPPAMRVGLTSIQGRPTCGWATCLHRSTVAPPPPPPHLLGHGPCFLSSTRPVSRARTPKMYYNSLSNCYMPK